MILSDNAVTTIDTLSHSGPKYGNINLSKYYFLVFIYLFSVLSSSFANLVNIDVQNMYRIPFLNIRWIDIAICNIILRFFYNLVFIKQRLRNALIISSLCYIYLIFESAQLIKSWGLMDVPTQISHYISTLCVFIIIDLLTFPVPIELIIIFLKKILIWCSITVTISNFYLLYAFFSGHVVYTDFDVRVALEVIGSNESVYSFILTSFVYALALYLIQRKSNLSEKILFLCAILSILISLVIQIFRSTLLMILVITIYFIFTSSNVKQILIRTSSLFLFIILGYLSFGDALAKKGYDPVDKISEIIEYSTDVKDPNWDKGRNEARQYAVAAWEKNFWTGAGYDELKHYGLPAGVVNPHNGVIQSLFHRGVIGTLILMLILFLLFKYALSLWFILKKVKNHQSDILKVLTLVSFLWIITFITEEALWEKYSLSIQFMFLGFIANGYKQIS